MELFNKNKIYISISESKQIERIITCKKTDNIMKEDLEEFLTSHRDEYTTHLFKNRNSDSLLLKKDTELLLVKLLKDELDIASEVNKILGILKERVD